MIDLDWAATKQARPFLPSCSDIVSIGRVRWIAGTKMFGKENYAWYRFDAHHLSGPIFHADESKVVTSRGSRLCAKCSRP